MTPMRMFVAVLPPPRALDDLEEFLAPRREAAPLRWTLPFQWHLTLAFMPQVPERRLDDLEERLGRAAGRRTPFRLGLSGGGAFPNPGRAKVLFAAVRTPPPADVELPRLATGVRAAANKAGAAAEGGPFRAHVTLARMGRPVEATRWLRVLSAYEGPEFDVTSVALVESHLGEGPRNKPRYDVVGSYALGTRHRDEEG